MSNILTIGYATEGSTDRRFLESIIKRTFDEIALTCENDIEVFDPVYIKADKQISFIETNLDIAKKAFNTGLHVLCIHVDADDENDDHVSANKIVPTFNTIKTSNENVCNNLVSIIPVRMTEAWMLADIELLMEEIGTQKTSTELGLHKQPERISNPKIAIENALRIAQDALPRRRNKLTINELYQPLGQQINIEKLSLLSSYIKFKNNVIVAFKTLNYLR